MELTPAPERLAELTRRNPYPRFEDGRPRVPDEILQRMRSVTTEEAWTVLGQNGFNHQFAGDFHITHPARVLVGRAVTAVFMPMRPDLHEVVEEAGERSGRSSGEGGQNTWLIDTLVNGDCMVVDMFGKVENGPFVGDNLSTAIQLKTGVGAVIDGTIRDFQGISQLPDITIFSRGLHPSFIREATLVGLNVPIRIGEATVLPGDVVLGTPTGVIFIPPSLAEAVVGHSERVHDRDAFSRERLREGRYTPGELDRRTWDAQIEGDFEAWRQTRQPGEAG